MDQPAWQEIQVFFKEMAISYIHLSQHQPRVSVWFQRNGKSEQFLQNVHPRQKVISTRAPQSRNYALTSNFLDLANLINREEAALATN